MPGLPLVRAMDAGSLYMITSPDRPPEARKEAAASSRSRDALHCWYRIVEPMSERNTAPPRPATIRNRCVCGRRRNRQKRPATDATGAMLATASGKANGSHAGAE